MQMTCIKNLRKVRQNLEDASGQLIIEDRTTEYYYTRIEQLIDDISLEIERVKHDEINEGIDE